MKAFSQKLLPLLLALILLLSLAQGALAEEAAPSDNAPSDAEDTGIIDGEALDKWMDAFLLEHQITGELQDFSVGFCYTATGDFWYYDADVFMYSASLYKVPVAMLIAEKEAAGELTQDSVIMNNTVQYLESTALTFSSNPSGHAMVDYMGGTDAGKCTDQITRFSQLPDSYFTDNYYNFSYYTARFMTQVMKTLYDGGDEAFPHIIEYLLPANPDGYLNRSLKDRFDVAQKSGAYKEGNGKDNNHIASIIYTPTPIIVVIMTRNVPNYELRMAEVGEHLADYAIQLDGQLEAYLQAQAATPAPTEEPAAPAEGEEPAAPAEPASEAKTPIANNFTSENRMKPMWIIAGVTVLAAVAAVLLMLPGKDERKEKRAAKEEDLPPRH